MSCTSISIHTRRDVWFVFRSLCPFQLDEYYDHWNSSYFYCHLFYRIDDIQWPNTEHFHIENVLLTLILTKPSLLAKRIRKKHQVFNLVKWLKNFALKSHEIWLWTQNEFIDYVSKIFRVINLKRMSET